ncbi:MAG TPA: UDP-N-acetylglucosamine pyrophosphorylase [Clostridiales bacterium]|jgi:NDP-sugar pyrophosphorylase family protein|nr:UDP-N-acetylglucosamine pyrophosphorylase [Clostridiales bacterium]HCG34805.1 UDP-N-acetylglucosamine pyrophosphorylase [Clostridiales bacterium]
MKIESLRILALYSLEHTLAAPLLAGKEYPWEVLSDIGSYIKTLGETLPPEVFYKQGDDVWIARSASVAPSAGITGPCIIDEGAEIRHCAYIRGHAMVGKQAVVGNSTELKNAILFDKVQVPHFNYIGDSILGFGAHMGAGSVTSNVKSDKTPVVIKGNGIKMETGRKKCGAMLGDWVEVGCNSVLNPGTIIGKNTWIYPASCVRGVIPANTIYKNEQTIVIKYE